MQKLIKCIFLGSLMLYGAEDVSGSFENMMELSSDEAKLEYIRSLGDGDVWTLASRAAEQGWSNYEIAAGIIDTHFGARWKSLPPDPRTLLAVVMDRGLHTRVRIIAGAAGLSFAPDWQPVRALEFTDALLTLLEDQTIDYATRHTLSERLLSYFQHEIDDSIHGISESDPNSIRPEDLFERVTRILEALMKIVRKGSSESLGSEHSLGSACGDMSRYLSWLIRRVDTTALPEATKEAMQRSQRVLVDAIRDPSYPAIASQVILRHVVDVQVDKLLSKQALQSFRNDPRFSTKRSQELLRELSKED